jgi:hypothetical protein
VKKRALRESSRELGELPFASISVPVKKRALRESSRELGELPFAIK